MGDTASKKRNATRTGEGADRVYAGLRRIIIDQTLAVGARLPEDSVAARFGVSRTVVREAIARLAADGLVERQSHRGARVAHPTPREADDIASVRREVETIIVRRLAGSISKKDVERLRQHVRLQQESFVDRRAAIRKSAEFHVLLAELTDSATLLRIVSDLVARSSLVFLAQATVHALHCGPREHGDIVDAIASGDPTDAEKKMQQHLKDVDERSRHIPGPAQDFADLAPTVFKELK